MDSEMDRKLLILDLDETLVFSTKQPLDHAHDFVVGKYYVYRRPHLDAFLETVARWFDLAVWTSANVHYAAGTIRHLFPDASILEFAWSRSRCTRRFDHETHEEVWTKNLRKIKRLGYRLEHVLIIDDSPEKLNRNYGNHIRVIPFLGVPGDSELDRLLPFLDWIRTAENVRTIEKRNWRSFVIE